MACRLDAIAAASRRAPGTLAAQVRAKAQSRPFTSARCWVRTSRRLDCSRTWCVRVPATGEPVPPAAGSDASSPEHATSDTTAIRVTADAATLAPDVDGVGQPIRTAMAIGMEVSGTICTYEPVCGAWTTCPLPMYIATCEMGE
jgi:hypothetical protein